MFSLCWLRSLVLDLLVCIGWLKSLILFVALGLDL
jgi:hypothetical protein